MGTGAVTSYIDVAQLTLYVFWAFFAGLIFYIRREDKREGYPLQPERSGKVVRQMFPPLPRAKVFHLADGSKVYAPRVEAAPPPINAFATMGFLGAPLDPLGNSMVDGVGPAAYAQRHDVPDAMVDGSPKIVPLRVDAEFSLDPNDADPRGMTVIGLDRATAGTVTDVWVDRMETMARYIEVRIADGSLVLVPATLITIDRARASVKVVSVTASQFADAPRTKAPEQITLLEEDRISAYFGGGHLYAIPSRSQPLI